MHKLLIVFNSSLQELNTEEFVYFKGRDSTLSTVDRLGLLKYDIYQAKFSYTLARNS